MNLSWIAGARGRSRFAKGASLIHSECPLEQVVRSEDPDVHDGLLREPWSGPRRDGVLLLGDGSGLRLLGRTECVLDAAVASLRQRFGDRLAVDPPVVRLAHGNPTLEPWMTVVVSASARHRGDVQSDFLARSGCGAEVRDGDPFVLEGEAPLARLLGYARSLRALAPEAHATIALSRYLPVDDGGPRAA